MLSDYLFMRGLCAISTTSVVATSLDVEARSLNPLSQQHNTGTCRQSSFGIVAIAPPAVCRHLNTSTSSNTLSVSKLFWEYGLQLSAGEPGRALGFLTRRTPTYR